MLQGTIKSRLVIQEVKKMNLDISKEIDEEIELRKTFHQKDSSDSILNANKEFAEAQAKKLGMKPEEYYKEYVKVTSLQNVSMNAYIEEMLGEPKADEKEIEKYNEKANSLLNELVKENEDEIEILIK